MGGTPKAPSKNNVPRPLIIFQESGKEYRPFTSPARIKCNDAKKSKSRTRTIPPEYLRIMVPTRVQTSIKREKGSTSPYSNTSNAPLSPTSPGGELEYVIKSPKQPKSVPLEPSPSQGPCPPSSPCPSLSSSSNRSSPSLPSSALSDTSPVYQDPSPTYPPSSPPFSPHDQHCLTSSLNQGIFPCTCSWDSKSQNVHPPDSQVDDGDLAGIDLEDPAVIAQALEIVREMRMEDMDIDLDLLSPTYDGEDGMDASSMYNKQSILGDGNIDAPKPCPLHTFPCEFFNHELF